MTDPAACMGVCSTLLKMRSAFSTQNTAEALEQAAATCQRLGLMSSRLPANKRPLKLHHAAARLVVGLANALRR